MKQTKGEKRSTKQKKLQLLSGWKLNSNEHQILEFIQFNLSI